MPKIHYKMTFLHLTKRLKTYHNDHIKVLGFFHNYSDDFFFLLLLHQSTWCSNSHEHHIENQTFLKMTKHFLIWRISTTYTQHKHNSVQSLSSIQ